MNMQQKLSKRMILRGFWIILLFSSIVIYVILPHREQTLAVHAKLHDGKSMTAQVTLQSFCGWMTPDRLVDLKVTFDGTPITLPLKAYYRLGPIDPLKQPIILEKFNVPLLVMAGKPFTGLTDVRWYFRERWLSQRDVRNGSELSTNYYATPSAVSVSTTLTKEELNGLPQLGKTRVKTLF